MLERIRFCPFDETVSKGAKQNTYEHPREVFHRKKAHHGRLHDARCSEHGHPNVCWKR